MSLGDLMEQMAAAGAPLEAILLAVRAVEARDTEAATRRAAAAKRKRDERERKRDRRVTVTGQSKDAPLNDNILNPPADVKTSAKRDRFVLPDWVPEAEWADFDEMRRSMPKVPWRDAAKRGVIAELDELRGKGHDPAKLLRKAVTRGWRQVFPGDDTMGVKSASINRGPMTAEQIQSAIRFNLEHEKGDPSKVEGLRAQLAEMAPRTRATGPPGRAIGASVERAMAGLGRA